MLYVFLIYVFRLRSSGSVQYFQFDESGNMFVFKPGSGFSGPCVKVEPGIEIVDTMQESLFDCKGPEVCSSTVSNVISDELQLLPASFNLSPEKVDPTPVKK